MMSSDKSPPSASESKQWLQRIVVGVCGSPPSFAALRYAIQLGKASSAAVEAVVIDELRVSLATSFADGETLSRLMREAERVAQVEFHAVSHQIKQLADQARVPVSVRHEEGRVADCLHEACAQASLMVIGKRGHRDAHGGLLGTNAELTLRRTHRPILLTPVAYGTIKRILVAYAAKAPGRDNLSWGRHLGAMLRVPMTVLTVQGTAQEGEAILDFARQELRETSTKTTYITRSGPPAAEIAAEAGEGTLLIIGSSGHSRLHRFILGDVTTQVVREARGPVLVSEKL